MITSKLTSKAQTPIPQPVRVVLTRARTEPTADDPFRTFSEWDSPADTQAYANL